MNFTIYLDEHTGQQLNELAKKVGESRNSLVRKAVGEWLAHQTESQWPELVVHFTGVADAPQFEASREQLRPVAVDPLA